MARFKFAAITSFWAPVKVITPGGEEQEFEAQFVYLDDKGWAGKQQVPTLDFLREHWTGWQGIVGADERAIDYSVEKRDELLDHSFVALAVITAYREARMGQRAKN